MPKLNCKCGNVINLSDIPSLNQYLFISDIEFDFFEGTVDSELIYSKMKISVNCPLCNRLYIFINGFENPPLIYKIEN